jgi:seryl-tRNA synthetase
LKNDVQSELNTLTSDHNQLEIENKKTKEVLENRVQSLIENNEQLHTNYKALQSSSTKIEADFQRLRAQIKLIFRDLIDQLSPGSDLVRNQDSQH